MLTPKLYEQDRKIMIITSLFVSDIRNNVFFFSIITKRTYQDKHVYSSYQLHTQCDETPKWDLNSVNKSQDYFTVNLWPLVKRHLKRPVQWNCVRHGFKSRHSSSFQVLYADPFKYYLFATFSMYSFFYRFAREFK